MINCPILTAIPSQQATEEMLGQHQKLSHKPEWHSCQINHGSMVAQNTESFAFQIVEDDRCLAKATSVNRKLMGFIHEICTYPSLKLIFTNESLLMIYHLQIFYI